MIMPRGEQLLLPANPLFIWASLLIALTINAFPIGRIAWAPDWLALVLIYWCVHQPLRVGLGVAFCMGLLTDVQSTGLLGQHAFSYLVMTYWANALQRRLPWFSLGTQAIQIAPVFFLGTGIELLLSMFTGGTTPGWLIIVAPAIQAALWPIVSVFLQAPQRRAPNRDNQRPI
jgi:rod shape-determining protein MreD